MMQDKTENILRWKSRRGLLELDLIFERFWRDRSGKLSAEELQELSVLLACEDDSLWRLIRVPVDELTAVFASLPSDEQDAWKANGGNLQGEIFMLLRDMQFKLETNL